MADTPYLKTINQNKKEFRTPDMKVPVIFHVSDSLLPDEETFEELESLGRDERLFDHIAALSDVHPKKGRKNPTGAVVASENYLFPQINDTAPNCGMRFIKTDLDSTNISLDKIDKIFEELVKTVPTKKYVGLKIPFDLSLEIGRSGIAPLKEHLGTRIKNEIENSYKNGNFFENENIGRREILDVIPKLFFHIGKYRLGILGAAGNHFLDLMQVSEIRDPETAQKFGIREGQVIFLLHTGSGLLGQYASYMYTPKVKEHFSQKMVLKLGTSFFHSQMKKIYCRIQKTIAEYGHRDEFLGYEGESLEGRMFIRAHRAACNFGSANRTAITDQIDKALEKVLGRQVELDMLYDTPHVFIDRENHFGKDVWIHRNGSVRANGPARMKNHPIFSTTGEPVFIPSSMTTPAYICAGTDENTSTFFSASHGTGRRKEAEENAPKSKSELLKKISSTNTKLFNAKSKGVVLQDSSYYKDVEEVISGMADNNIVKIVAKMQPVAVLMY
jgi:tRNA-splicing ligase RtcB (3'-phosphate/5'-hydroxy nucleic acid ligase)